MATTDRITPHYLTLAHGQLRLWRAGAGGGAIVLCGPALGARALAAALADRAVDVFELPGIGGSASLPVDDLDTVAAALAEAIALIGGTATLVAVDLAAGLLPALIARLPARPRLVTVGLARAEAWRDRGFRAPPLAPRPDGTHLTTLWHHLRDAHLLEPADPTLPATAGDPIPTAVALDAAFTAVAVRPERFAALWNLLVDAPVSAEALGAADHLAALADLPAALAPAPLTARALPPTMPRPDGALWYDHVETVRGRVHLRRAGGEGTPLLVLPTGGGSSEQFAPVITGLADGRQVFAIDYFGNGLSDRRDDDVEIGDLAEDAAAVVAALGFDRVDVWGSHTGSLVGLELALRHPHRVRRLVLEGPVFVAPDFKSDLLDHYFPAIRPDGWGLHLPLVWNWRRDMFLYWPWYRVDRAAARRLGLPSAEQLHLYAVGILESGPTYDRAYRSAFRYDTAGRLPQLACPTLVCAGPDDMLINGLAETERLAVPGVEVCVTPTTVWWPDPPAEAAAETLALYDAFLKG